MNERTDVKRQIDELLAEAVLPGDALAGARIELVGVSIERLVIALQDRPKPGDLTARRKGRVKQ